MIYVVLGMHKSGTTLISQMLHYSGINMGVFDEGLDYTDNNQFERHSTQEINRELLHGTLLPPMDYMLRRNRQPEYNSAGYRRNKDSIAIVRLGALRKKLNNADLQPLLTEIQKLHAAHNDWGYKDPRTCLTYPAWKRVLPDHRIVVVYRHYSQLVNRYRIKKYDLTRLYRVLYSWTLHNRAILSHIEGSAAPAIFISYEDMMHDDGEFERLQHFINHPLMDAREPTLYRNRNKKVELPAAVRILKPLLPADPDRIYAELGRWRACGADGQTQGSGVTTGINPVTV